MRIIGGESSGRRIRAPKGSDTRPTSDKVREALFNILGPPPVGTRVLDLFAGTGGLGLEALSRGAASAVFVDRASAAAKCLAENIETLQVGGRAQVLRADVDAALKRLANAGERFDWIFADPPYAGDDALRTLAALGSTRSPLLAPSGVLLIEHDKRNPLPDQSGELSRIDTRMYGDTAVSFYGKRSLATGSPSPGNPDQPVPPEPAETPRRDGAPNDRNDDRDDDP